MKKQDDHPKTRDVILLSFAVDLLDVILAFVVAALSGSIVMVSQVLEGVADLISSGLLVIGLQRSSKHSDKGHPFGYGREIYFWALISALVTFGISASLSFYLGWQRFFRPEEVHDLPLTFGVLILTLFTNSYAFLKSLQSLLRKRDIRKIIPIFYRSSLVETKTTFILDLMGSSASLFGIIALLIYFYTKDYRYDGVGAMAIGASTAIFAYFLILGIRDLMIGRSAPPEVEERIKKATKKIKEVEDVLGLKTMHIGSGRLLVNLDVHLNDQLTTNQIEKLIDQIKKEVRKEVPSAKNIQVELETPES